MKTRRGHFMVLTSATGLLLGLTLQLWASGAEAAPACKKGFFPASGQTTCWDSDGNEVPCFGSGQDGDIRAGTVLRYRDNEDGTITDLNTNLQWEKKSDDGTIHDKDAAYTWANAFAVHVAGLNQANFAGHQDWRLPNVKELQSIIDYEKSVAPVVALAFNTGCSAACTVLTCSCTGEQFYWSSTTTASNPSSAWIVSFFAGDDQPGAKSALTGLLVRAVREGCVE